MPGRLWTNKEIEYLQNQYCKTNINHMAKHLNRTPRGIKNKARALGISPYEGDIVYAREMCRCFDTTMSVIHRWIRYGVPHKKVKRGEIVCIIFNIESFWKWAANNKNLINWNRYELNTLLPQPEWVIEEKRKYKAIKHREKITSIERLHIESLYRSGKTTKEIANEVGRTYYSVKNILRNSYSRKEENK